MGHAIVSMNSMFKVKKKNFDPALRAIQNLAGKETVTKKQFPGLGSDDHFMYIDAKQYLNTTNFLDAMLAWRWLLEEDEEGNAIDPSFTGENAGDEDILFEAIAPYVENGSFIQAFSIDREVVFRWVFKKGKVKHKFGKIIFGLKDLFKPLEYK